MRQFEHVAPRMRIDAGGGNGLAERHKRARAVAHGIAHHLGQLASERPLAALHFLVREDEVFEDQVVGDGAGHEQQFRSAPERGVHQAGLRRLELAAVAASALDVEHQVVAAEDLGDVGLERDQVARVLDVATDGNRAGDMADG